MTVKELIALLRDVDPDLPVICQRYSDYMEQEPPFVVEAFKDGSHFGWKRYYPGQWTDEDRPAVVKALFFEGN